MGKTRSNSTASEAAAGGGGGGGGGSKLFIGGLSYDTTDASLERYFADYGQVDSAVVLRDPTTLRSRGFGFVTFSSPKAAKQVVSYTHHLIDGRKVEAKVAVPRATANSNSSNNNNNDAKGNASNSSKRSPRNKGGGKARSLSKSSGSSSVASVGSPRSLSISSATGSSVSGGPASPTTPMLPYSAAVTGGVTSPLSVNFAKLAAGGGPSAGSSSSNGNNNALVGGGLVKKNSLDSLGSNPAVDYSSGGGNNLLDSFGQGEDPRNNLGALDIENVGNNTNNNSGRGKSRRKSRAASHDSGMMSPRSASSSVSSATGRNRKASISSGSNNGGNRRKNKDKTQDVGGSRQQKEQSNTADGCIISNKIFVGGLLYATGHESLRSFFEVYGSVDTAEVIYNRDTKKSRGFGFVVFREHEAVDKVLAGQETDGMHVIDGKQVEVKRCVARQETPKGGDAAGGKNKQKQQQKHASSTSSAASSSSSSSSSSTADGASSAVSPHDAAPGRGGGRKHGSSAASQVIEEEKEHNTPRQAEVLGREQQQQFAPALAQQQQQQALRQQSFSVDEQASANWDGMLMSASLTSSSSSSLQIQPELEQAQLRAAFQPPSHQQQQQDPFLQRSHSFHVHSSKSSAMLQPSLSFDGTASVSSFPTANPAHAQRRSDLFLDEAFSTSEDYVADAEEAFRQVRTSSMISNSSGFFEAFAPPGSPTGSVPCSPLHDPSSFSPRSAQEVGFFSTAATPSSTTAQRPSGSPLPQISLDGCQISSPTGPASPGSLSRESSGIWGTNSLSAPAHRSNRSSASAAEMYKQQQFEQGGAQSQHGRLESQRSFDSVAELNAMGMSVTMDAFADLDLGASTAAPPPRRTGAASVGANQSSLRGSASAFQPGMHSPREGMLHLDPMASPRMGAPLVSPGSVASAPVGSSYSQQHHHGLDVQQRHQQQEHQQQEHQQQQQLYQQFQ